MRNFGDFLQASLACIQGVKCSIPGKTWKIDRVIGQIILSTGIRDGRSSRCSWWDSGVTGVCVVE